MTETTTAMSGTVRRGCDSDGRRWSATRPLSQALASLMACHHGSGRVRGVAHGVERAHAARPTRTTSTSSWRGATAAAAPTSAELDQRALRRYFGVPPDARRSRGRRSRARPRRCARTSGTSAGAGCSQRDAAHLDPGAQRPAAVAADAATSRSICSAGRRRRTLPTPTIPARFATSRSLELLYGAGLRVSECCGLDVGDVDLRQGTVTVLGKGSKVRRLPLGEPALRRGSRRTCAARPARARATATARAPTVPQRPGPPHDAPRRAPRPRPPSAAPTGGPCIRTLCGMRTRRTCSRAAPTCGRFRSCSDTPMWEPRRSTLT